MNTVIKIGQGVLCPSGKWRFIAVVETSESATFFPYIQHAAYPNVFLGVAVREMLTDATFIGDGDGMVAMDARGEQIGTILVVHSTPPPIEEEMFE